MTTTGNYQGIIQRIQGGKPQLLQSFQNSLETLEAFVPVDDAARMAVFKITWATEFFWFEESNFFPLLLLRQEFAVFADLLYTIGSVDYQYARVLMESYQRLRFPLALIDADIRFLVQAASAVKGKGHNVLEICLKYEDGEMCRFMLSSLSVIARHSPATMVECAQLIFAQGRNSPPELIRQWISRGTDLITSDRVDEGIKFLLLKSSSGRQMLGMNHVVLEDYKNILKIYIASLAGKDLNINSLDLSMFGLKAAYTDGATLFLPAQVNFFREARLNQQVYTVLAALQAASISMGSFALDMETFDFKTELRERYGTLLPEILTNARKQYSGIAESVRTRLDGEIEAVFPNKRKLLLLNTEHEKYFYSFPTPDLARELFTLVENWRIEARLGALYPGLHEDFLLVNAYLWKKRQRVSDALSDSKGEFGGFFIVLEALIQYSLLGRWGVEIPERKNLDCVRKICKLLDKVRREDTTVQDSAGVMFEIYNAFFDAFRLELICSRFSIADSFTEVEKPQFWPEVVLELQPDLMKHDEVSEFVSQEEPSVDKIALDFSSFQESRKNDDQIRKAVNSGSVRIYRYQEFDCLRGGYLPKRCTLFEMVAQSTVNDYHEQVLRRHAMVYKKTRKRFLSMKPDDMEISRRWYSGTDINISDAVDYCLSLRRGETPDEKIYYRKILNRRDLAVAVLLDASFSTDMQVGGRSVIDIEKDSLVILASALDAIGDTFGLFSFNSEGPDKVYVSVVKDFQEKWEARTQQRINSIKPYESNRDGCAIRHIAARLSDRPEKVKLLLLLSDGIPADVDYGAQTGMHASKYAIEDTRRAIQESRELGIIPFCLNIDSHAKEYIAHLYGAYHYAILDDVSRLPERLSQLYLRLTG